MNNYKNIIFILVTVFAVLTQLTNPTLAYADDGEPPTPPAESGTVVLPPDEPVVTELPSEPAESATEAAPAESPATTEAPADAGIIPAADAATEEPTVTEVIQQIPAETGIVVLDEAGEVVPLTTQAAADIIASGDPVWCPTGVVPDAGVGGCSGTYTSLSALVAGFVPTSNGTIWIQNVPDTGSAVDIDGVGAWSSAKGYNLTLQGGWTLAPNLGAISGTSTFDTPISITNWTGAVTVNNITIKGAIGTGLTIHTDGDISIQNATSSGNTHLGVELDNSSGAGDVTLTGTNVFNNNGLDGIDISSNGNVLLSNIAANGNKGNDIGDGIAWGDGLWVDNSSGAGNVTLTGTNVFNNNHLHGLVVISNGNISSVNNVTASGNTADGANLNNASGAGDVTLTGANIFNGNHFNGLVIASKGNITTNNVTASGNKGDGANLNNSSGTGDVTLTGANVFNDNHFNGLEVESQGDIMANNITASGNNVWNVTLTSPGSSNPVWCPAGQAPTPGSNGCTASYRSLRNLLASEGASINSNGTIWMTTPSISVVHGASAISNQNFSITGGGDTSAISIDGSTYANWATQTLTLQGGWSGTSGDTAVGSNSAFFVPISITNWQNSATLKNITVSSAAGTGITVKTTGDITLDDITASDNTGNGATLDNASGAGNVILTGTNVFNGNHLNGLAIVSKGNITANNITASDNTSNGAALDNASGAGNVILTGMNVFNNNAGSGLTLSSSGNITLNNITASRNTGDGANLNNTSGTGNVTLTGANFFNDNHFNGLEVESQGDIMANNITASGNGIWNVILNTNNPSNPVWCPEGQSAPTPGLNGCTASYATLGAFLAGAGASINSNGVIWMKTTSVSDASTVFNQNFSILGGGGDASGISIDGSTYASWATHTLTLQGGWSGTSGDTTIGSNSAFFVPISITNWQNAVTLNNITVNGAAGTGINVNTSGDIFMDNITSSGNAGYGAYLTGTGNITLTGTNVFKNNTRGLVVRSNGNITLNNITSSNTIVELGAYLNNEGGGGNVTLAGTNEFSNNTTGHGLWVSSKGNITASNITASGNGHAGLYLNNGSGTGVNVTVTGTNVFNDNHDMGLLVVSAGNINVQNVTVNHTQGDGVYLVSVAGGNLVLNNIISKNNSINGLYLFTAGSAVVTGSTFTGNTKFDMDASDVCERFASNNVTFSTFDPPAKGIRTDAFTGEQIYCEPKVYINGVLMGAGDTTETQSVTSSEVTGNQFEFNLSCATRSNFFVTLPNGDQIQIFCPVSGKAFIKRLDNTMLPADLPEGYTYNSAFSLEIFQGQQSIPVIGEGGSVTASFELPPSEAGTSYSILYWDNGRWIALKDFIIDENGNPRSFDLHTGDPRVILSGLSFVYTDGVPRVEATTNFPGIFVLVQH